MSLWFNCICRRKDLFHRISSYLKARKSSTPHSYKYENYSISKFIEIAEKMDIEVVPLGFGIYEFKKGDMKKRVTIGLGCDKQNLISSYICRNKYLTYKVLEDNGIRHLPKYQLYTFKNIRNTIRDFKEWNCPVVIKPCSDTYGGYGVTVNIKTIKELRNAIAESFVFDRKYFLMEQYIEGSHFRLLTLKGKFISCYQRIPAKIIGNGRDSIKTLIYNENKKRSTDSNMDALYPILVNNEVKRKLRSMNMSLKSVPKLNEEVFLRDNVNYSVGGELKRIDKVSESIKSTCRNMTEILDIYLGGFDIITSDINKPLEETNGVINEVNADPGTNCQYQITQRGEPVHVAEIILKDMFNLQNR